MKARAERVPGSERHRRWTGGVFRAQGYVDDPIPYRPDLVLWTDELGLELVSWLVHPRESRLALATALGVALTRARQAGRPLPEAVHVRKPPEAEAVRTAAGRLPVHVGDCGLLSMVAFERTADLPELMPPDGYLRGRIEPSAMGRLFDALATLVEGGVPWRPGAPALLRVDAPSLGLDSACLWVGHEAVGHGLHLYQDLGTYRDTLAELWSGVYDPDEEEPVPCPSLCVGLVPAEAATDKERREVDAHRWRQPGEGLPRLLAFDEQQVQRPLIPTDVRIATALCTALAALVRRGPPATDGPGARLEEVAVGVRSEHRVRLTSRHPDARDEDLEACIDEEWNAAAEDPPAVQ